MLDARLMPNHKVRECEGRDEESECGCLSKETIQAMVVRGVITLLCGVALYASLFMLNKTRRAARGEVKGPSVVKTPRAHLFGIPNSLVGSLYYPGMAVAVWVVRGTISDLVLLIVAFGAAATSAYLAYSLIYVTRRECPYCWTAHIVNWCLLALCSYLFLPDILNRGI
ncbi:MAG TPA: vitamin K epoxide reductase family protein [Candidatus Cybelea sp.]|nr:vitamin K epoxide reductase family protein [Candidatus Cybelea sp.]